MVRCLILWRLQPDGWWVFWSLTTTTWTPTLPKSDVHFFISRLDYVEGTENRAWHGRRVFAVRKTWPNKWILLSSIHSDRVLSETVPNTGRLVWALLKQSLHWNLVMTFENIQSKNVIKNPTPSLLAALKNWEHCGTGPLTICLWVHKVHIWLKLALWV